MLTNPEIAFELAQLDIREHHRRAALDALAAHLADPASGALAFLPASAAATRTPGARAFLPANAAATRTPGARAFLPASAAAARTRLAAGLRGIAVRLDPTLNCEPASRSALMRVPTPR